MPKYNQFDTKNVRHALAPPAPTVLPRGNPVKCLAQGHNKRTWRLIFTLIPVER